MLYVKISLSQTFGQFDGMKHDTKWTLSHFMYFYEVLCYKQKIKHINGFLFRLELLTVPPKKDNSNGGRV